MLLVEVEGERIGATTVASFEFVRFIDTFLNVTIGSCVVVFSPGLKIVKIENLSA